MRLQPSFIVGRVVAGRLEISDAALRSAIAGWPDGNVVIEVKPERNTRSQRANRWYWGSILPLISEHTGYDVDELHDLFKMRFFPKHVALADDNGVIKGEGVVGGSTARLTTGEFSEYCERVRRFAAEELGVVIPDPREVAA